MSSGWTLFSELLGYASIGCWLGAQFPQVFKNIKNQSCEGLALPFLANWLAGDVSNFIGCLLTDQLPFQTWLATYFCLVDMMLLGQYYYYYKIPDVSAPRTHSRLRASSTLGRTSSDRHYRTISTVAANVAASAALAAQQDEQESHSPQYPRVRRQKSSVDRVAGRSISRDAVDDEDEIDEAALAALSDSSHSESGRSTRRKLVSWNTSDRTPRGPTSPLHASLQITAVSQAAGDSSAFDRGRSMQREGDEEVVATIQDGWTGTRSRTNSTHRASSRASRRGAGLVFLGVWALFGVGMMAGSGRGLLVTTEHIGRVLNDRPLQPEHASFKASIAFIQSAFGVDQPNSETSRERVLGRIFAWLCTTLYLTSRLPQIWKNWARKSVEGLSMYLFFFAFLGNFFYVASILTGPSMRLPPAERDAYIREAVPYVLGSAGVLMFDVTIVCQSFVYHPRSSLRQRGRRGSTRIATAEEEAGLLHGDALGN